MRPLEGLFVLDLSRVLAAPLGTMMMAEMGATVIKVEQPGSGDELRVNHPFIKGESGYFFAANRSKKSITLNLKTPEAQDIVRKLAAQADIVVENYVVGTLARMKLDYESLKAISPRLVYISLTGFGQDGPYAKRRGYDTILQAMTGMMSLTGERGRGPVKAGLPTVDLSCALWTVVAALSGIVGRAASGHGCYVDVSMMDTQVAMLAVAAARYFALGEVPERMGSEHLGRVPSGAFPCGDGKWVQITTGDNQWPDLCTVLGIAEWGAHPDVATNDARLQHRELVMGRLREELAKYKRDDIVEKCSAAGVPMGPINDLSDVFNDPHVKARGMVQNFEHPVVGSFPGLAVPLKFHDLDDAKVGRPPLLGEHTDEILAQYLKFDAAQISELRRKGAV
jgi:crotonobetainyl-CoA:carnitine CoA-transferase CaiB-like acyl-CoA transferase